MSKKKKQIKVNDDQLLLEANRVADLYHQLTLDLFDNVVERVRDRGTEYLQKQPFLWQLEKMNELGLLNEDNVKLIEARSGVARELLEQIIYDEGYNIYKDTHEQLGSNGYPDHRQIQSTLAAYSRQAFLDLDNLINTTLPESVIGTYRGIVEKSVAKVATGMVTADRAVNDTVMEWFEKGFYGFTDKSGRRWKADNYARTVVKSTVARIRNEMLEAPARELGIDTFYYSVKATARAMCAPIQGKIVTTGQARFEGGEVIHALDDYGYGLPGGCLGINCGHTKTPFIPGVNKKPELDEDLKGITPEQAIENANVQTKQRALERSIRHTKEQIHVAKKLDDTELIERYTSKLGKQKRALKSFLDEHKFLYRDREREKYQKDPVSWAETELKQRKELRNRLKNIAQNDTIKLQNIQLPQSLSAMARDIYVKSDYPVRGDYLIKRGSKITNVEVIAGKDVRRQIDDIRRLVREHGGNAKDWQKVKGIATLSDGSKIEAHWYQAKNVGKVEFKVKRWL